MGCRARRYGVGAWGAARPTAGRHLVTGRGRRGGFVGCGALWHNCDVSWSFSYCRSSHHVDVLGTIR